MVIFDKRERLVEATVVECKTIDKGGFPGPFPIAGTSPTCLLLISDADVSGEIVDGTADIVIDDKQRVVVEAPLGPCKSSSTQTMAFEAGAGVVPTFGTEGLV